MSHIQSHHNGVDKTHNTFLVVLRVDGGAIRLWSSELMSQIDDSHEFRIFCHAVDEQTNSASDIKVFSLKEPAQLHDEQCAFDEQQTNGQPITPQDLVIFMTGPVSSSRNASYALDLAVVPIENNVQDLRFDEPVEKIGTSYLYIDAIFSSRGIQRTPIIAQRTRLPIGQLQIEYLVVTNPVGYGQPEARPSWLIKQNNLQAGHRGSGAGRRVDLPEKLLENSIASFNYAHRHGADMCELDVIMSADGVPVVYHDFDVDAVAAHKSSDELGKIRVQVNQFTMKQLREFRLLSLQDGDGHAYTLNVPNQAECNKPFPTLAEVLDQVDETCGLNIEIKWPQMLESGKMEAKPFREINDFVDKIIQIVDKHARDRRIILESFDPDLTIMLRLKQTRFPVFFLSQGMTERYERYTDTRARSVFNGVYFAQAFGLVGIDIISDYYLSLGKELVRFVEAHNLVARSWMCANDNGDILDILKGFGLQCITYDKIDQVTQADKMNRLS